MNLQVTGILIHKGDTQHVSERFKKREFVIEIAEEINGNTYSHYGKFQLVNNRCDLIDKFNLQQKVTVKFNITGNRWERDGKVNYITQLTAYAIENA